MNKYTKLTEVFQTYSDQIVDQKQTISENANHSITSKKDISSAAIGNEVLLCIFSTFKSLNYRHREKELKNNSTPNFLSLQITFML
jgi:hypothetical protein